MPRKVAHHRVSRDAAPLLTQPDRSGCPGDAREGGCALRVLVVSQNRLAGLGLLTLCEGSGLTAELVSVAEARAGARGGDLALLYCDSLDAGALRAVETLHAAHARFLVLVRDLGEDTRRLLLAAGAVHAFAHDATQELSLVLANYRWSDAPQRDTFTLANGFVIDLPRRRLHRDGNYLELTLTECQLLLTLCEAAQAHPGVPVPLVQINVAVWGFPDARSPTTLRGYIRSVRAKIELEPERPAVLLGRRGRGYWLVLGA